MSDNYIRVVSHMNPHINSRDPGLGMIGPWIIPGMYIHDPLYIQRINSDLCMDLFVTRRSVQSSLIHPGSLGGVSRSKMQ